MLKNFNNVCYAIWTYCLSVPPVPINVPLLTGACSIFNRFVFIVSIVLSLYRLCTLSCTFFMHVWCVNSIKYEYEYYYYEPQSRFGRQIGRQRQTTKCVLPLTYVDLFRSIRTALTLIKTMQPRGANVICVRLHKLTRRPRTVPDSDKAATPNRVLSAARRASTRRTTVLIACV